MKAIMISIKPKYVADILNGKKTIEIRKTLPKCDLPIDVYIYCTKDKKYANLINRGGFLTGMVVAKFTLNMVEPIAQYDGNEERYFTKSLWETELFEKSCLGLEEMRNYIHNHYGYAWHIDNLVIFDKPKELKEFYVYSHSIIGTNIQGETTSFEILKPLTKAPQSYCYIKDVLWKRKKKD